MEDHEEDEYDEIPDSGTRYKMLSKAQFYAIAQNLIDGLKALLKKDLEMTKKLEAMERAGQTSGPEYQALLSRLDDADDAIEDTRDDIDEMERERTWRGYGIWKQTVLCFKVIPKDSN